MMAASDLQLVDVPHKRFVRGAGSEGGPFIPQPSCMQPKGHWDTHGALSPRDQEPGLIAKALAWWLMDAKWVSYSND